MDCKKAFPSPSQAGLIVIFSFLKVGFQSREKTSFFRLFRVVVSPLAAAAYAPAFDFEA